MAKELRCGDVMPGCPHVIREDTEEELMTKAVEHAKDAHGLAEIDEATAEKVKAAVRDV